MTEDMAMPTIYQLTLICAVLLGAFYALIGLLRLSPTTANAAIRVWPDLKSATITFGITIGFLTLGGWLLKGFLFAVFLRVSFEAVIVAAPRMALSDRFTPKPLALALAFMSAFLLALAHFIPIATAILFIGALFALSLLATFSFRGKSCAVGFEVLLFPVCPAAILVVASGMPQFQVLALAAYIIVETFDGYALVGGKNLGKTPAFPTLSPKKTVEGLLIGAGACAASVSIAGYLLLGLQLVPLMVFTLVVAGFTVLGDLAGSALKRRSGVKDFPVISPTQGGVLDIYDAWIVAVAALGLLYSLGLVYWPDLLTLR
jgi:CDP-diglyceride synthetase